MHGRTPRNSQPSQSSSASDGGRAPPRSSFGAGREDSLALNNQQLIRGTFTALEGQFSAIKNHPLSGGAEATPELEEEYLAILDRTLPKTGIEICVAAVLVEMMRQNRGDFISWMFRSRSSHLSLLVDGPMIVTALGAEKCISIHLKTPPTGYRIAPPRPPLQGSQGSQGSRPPRNGRAADAPPRSGGSRAGPPRESRSEARRRGRQQSSDPRREPQQYGVGVARGPAGPPVLSVQDYRSVLAELSEQAACGATVFEACEESFPPLSGAVGPAVPAEEPGADGGPTEDPDKIASWDSISQLPAGTSWADCAEAASPAPLADEPKRDGSHVSPPAEN